MLTYPKMIMRRRSRFSLYFDEMITA